jgi:hypothetical protein
MDEQVSPSFFLSATPSTITNVIAAPAIPAFGATTAAVATTTKTPTATAATAPFSTNNEDGAQDDWNVALLGPMTHGNVAASGDDCHHVDHYRLQVFDLLSSDSESEDEIDASEFDACDEF